MTTFMTVRPPVPEPKPMIIPGRTVGEQILVRVFVLIPFAAVRIALALARGFWHAHTMPRTRR